MLPLSSFTRLRLLLPFLIAAFIAAGCAASGNLEDEESLHVVVISDLNSSYGSTEYEPEIDAVVDLLVRDWQPDLVLIAGDLIAGQRVELTDENVAAMWQAFDERLFTPLREGGIAVTPAMGNHDASRYERFHRDREFARAYWSNRSLGVDRLAERDFPMNYAYRLGELFVVVWDATNEALLEDDGLVDWVADQLQRPEATGARHRWVVGHLPLYAVAEGRNRSGEVLAHADSLRTLLFDHDVDVYVSGHHHAFYPGRRGALELLHSGALGQGARQLIGSDLPPMQTVTSIHIRGDDISSTTFAVDADAESLLREIDLQALPRRIEGFNGYVDRVDVRP